MKATVLAKWNDKQFETAQKLDMTKRMAVAVVEVERYIKDNFGTRKSRGDPAPSGSAPNVQTGRLRASITHNYSGSGRGSKASWGGKKQKNEGQYWSGQVGAGVEEPKAKYPIITGVVGTNVKYAKKLEFGIGCNPHPFMIPAIEANRSAIKRIFGIK